MSVTPEMYSYLGSCVGLGWLRDGSTMAAEPLLCLFPRLPNVLGVGGAQPATAPARYTVNNIAGAAGQLGLDLKFFLCRRNTH